MRLPRAAAALPLVLTAAALLTTAAAAPGTAVPRAAVPVAAGSAPVRTDSGTFVLSVTEGRGRIQSVSLECSAPPEGTHPSPGAACAQITAARGDFGALPHRAARCPAPHDPVTATAAGTWRGRQVNWRRSYASSCALAAHTGRVFDF